MTLTAQTAWWSIPVALLGGLILLWVALVLTLWLMKPDGTRLADAVRLLPDIVRLLARLAADRALPRRARVAIAATIAYLALPVDVVPDFLPVVGYADDAILVALVLRYVARRAGAAALERHWPGTPDGLAALRRLCRLPGHPTGSASTDQGTYDPNCASFRDVARRYEQRSPDPRRHRCCRQYSW